MKWIAALLFALVFPKGDLAYAMGSSPGSEGSLLLPSFKGTRLVVYYFHGTYRCPACKSVERQSKEAVEGDFAEEIKEGEVVYLSVNTEKPENRHFVNDYKLYFKSLVLSLQKDGKEVKWKNLAEVWTHVRSPDKYREYVRTEMTEMLKEVKRGKR